jgi:hypothetical protein
LNVGVFAVAVLVNFVLVGAAAAVVEVEVDGVAGAGDVCSVGDVGVVAMVADYYYYYYYYKC